MVLELIIEGDGGWSGEEVEVLGVESQRNFFLDE